MDYGREEGGWMSLSFKFLIVHMTKDESTSHAVKKRHSNSSFTLGVKEKFANRLLLFKVGNLVVFFYSPKIFSIYIHS